MATIRLIYRPSDTAGREGCLAVRIIHHRRVRYLTLGIKLLPAEWDSTTDSILTDSATNPKRRQYLTGAEAKVSQAVSGLRNIIARLDAAGQPYTSDAVVRQFAESNSRIDFIAFAQHLIDKLRAVGNQSKADRYKVVVGSLRRFLGDRSLGMDEIDATLIVRYETWLLARGLLRNTTSYYMRGLRAIFNRAVEAFDLSVRSPFGQVYTGVDKTRKRALSLSCLRKISSADLSGRPRMAFARDMFMFSFYTRGMSFVDMAYLRRCDLQGDVLTYRRRKTGQSLYIRCERQMQTIIDRYATPDSPYLLPLIMDPANDTRRQYKNSAHTVNRHLKRLGLELGLPIPLTTYVARHSWASQAQARRVAISTISVAMGHDSERTTRIYLASLDTASVDRANRRVISNL